MRLSSDTRLRPIYCQTFWVEVDSFAAERAVGAGVVVVEFPAFDDPTGLGEGWKPVQVSAFVAKRADEALSVP